MKPMQPRCVPLLHDTGSDVSMPFSVQFQMTLGKFGARCEGAGGEIGGSLFKYENGTHKWL